MIFELCYIEAIIVIKHLRISAKVLYYYSNPDFITFLRHYKARIENQ